MRSTTTRVHSDGRRRQLLRRKFALRVLDGPDRGKAITCSDDEASIGSSVHNDLALSDPAVSRHHLRVEVGDDGFTLTDLGSTNGSAISGGSLRLGQITTLEPLDLRLGESVVRFEPLADETVVELPDIDSFGAVLGRSPLMVELFAKLRRAAERDVTVLLEGETGTGKELVAHELHRHSARRDGPFIIVDCGAIPDGLIQSELFGHRGGSFTGALADRVGAFEEADGGTIFLDEIGELDLAMQPHLLRVLERRQVKRLGETHYRPVNVRVIAATNRDLPREVNRDAFRADLFYRLAVVRLRLPALRQRPDDIELMVERMLPQIAARYGLAAPEIDARTLGSLQRHPWLGNVRELRNFLERLVTLSGGQSGFDPERELRLPAVDHGGAETLLDELSDMPFKDAKARWTGMFDIEYLKRLLARCDNNVAEAARQSGIDRVHIFRLIKKYRLRRPS